MKKAFLFFILFFLFYCSCYKVSNISHGNIPPTFNVSNNGRNLNDFPDTLRINDSSTAQLNLQFMIINGDPENYPITCAVMGLPSGLTVSPDSFVFKLNNNANFSFSATNASIGVHPININVKDASGAQNYTVYLKVLPVPDGAPGLVGTYSGSDPCGHFSIGDIWYTYSTTVSIIPGNPHWISIKNFRGLGDSISVSAFVSYDNVDDPWVGKINIPKQSVGGYTIYGNGQGYYGIDENEKPSISIYGDTIIHNGDTQTCYTQLRQ